MAFAVTLGEMVTSCQQLANQPGGEKLDVTEWKSHISTHYGRIHSVVSNTAAWCFKTEATINLSNLAMPSDHKSTIGVDFVLDSSGRRRELPELMVQERNIFRATTGEARAWSFSGTSLELWPTPTSGTYKHLYVPQPTRYNTSVDATSIDFLTTDGYEAVMWGVTSVALHRSESAQQRALGEAKAALDRLKGWAVQRALTQPKRQIIRDVDARPWDINGAWNPASWIFNR